MQYALEQTLKPWSSVCFKGSEGPFSPTWFILISRWSHVSHCRGTCPSALRTTMMSQIKSTGLTRVSDPVFNHPFHTTLQLGHAACSPRELGLSCLHYLQQASRHSVHYTCACSICRGLGVRSWVQVSALHLGYRILKSFGVRGPPIFFHESPWQYQALRLLQGSTGIK